MTSFDLNYLLKTPSPYIVTLWGLGLRHMTTGEESTVQSMASTNFSSWFKNISRSYFLDLFFWSHCCLKEIETIHQPPTSHWPLKRSFCHYVIPLRERRERRKKIIKKNQAWIWKISFLFIFSSFFLFKRKNDRFTVILPNATLLSFQLPSQIWVANLSFRLLEKELFHFELFSKE